MEQRDALKGIGVMTAAGALGPRWGWNAGLQAQTPPLDWGNRVLREADVGFGNCEETSASIGFYGRRVAYPSMMDDFKASGLNTLALSNNHLVGQAPIPAGGELMNSREIWKSLQWAPQFARICQPHIPLRSGFPSAVRGAGADMLGLPSGVRGTPRVG